MKTYLGYNVTNTDYEFILDMQGNVVNQLSFNVESANFGFMVEPVNGFLEVWRFDEKIGTFLDLDDLLLNFKIHEKSFIEIIQDFDFA